MVGYVSACAGIAACTEAAIAASTVTAAVYGDPADAALQGTAGCFAAGGAAYYLGRVTELTLRADTETRSLATAQEKTGSGSPLVAAKQGLVVLATAAALLETVLMLNGFGQPSGGNVFGGGSRRFTVTIAPALQDAVATAWVGAGSAEYNDKNVEQQTRVRTMAAADLAIAEALEDQASAVNVARWSIAGMIAGLAASALAAVEMYRRCRQEYDLALFSFANSDPVAGKLCWEYAWTWAWALVALVTVAVSAALGGVLYLLYHLMAVVAPATKRRVERAQDCYRSIVRAALLASGPVVARERLSRR